MSEQQRALVVEDEAAIRNLFVSIGINRGFEVKAVGTVAEAMKAIEEEKFNILFVDFKLQDGTGNQVAKAMKEKHPETLRISISSDPGQFERDLIVLALRKPFTSKDIREHLDYGRRST